MSEVLIGCGPFPPKRTQFLARFGCVELSEAMQEPIGIKTLQKWNQERPPGFRYILGASRWLTLEPLDERRAAPVAFPTREFGLFRPTEANRAIWAQVREQADALGADSVLFRSPPAFSPSTDNRDALSAFRSEVVGDVPFELVWEARGIWTAEELATLGEELGMTIVRDPHAEAGFPDPTPDAYYAVTAPVGHVRFREDDLYELSEFLDDHDGTVRVVFRGPDREHNAKALLDLRNRLAGAPPG